MCCSSQWWRGIFRGRSEFRGTQFGAKKRRRKKKKKKQAEKGSETGEPAERHRGHRGPLPRLRAPGQRPETPAPRRPLGPPRVAAAPRGGPAPGSAPAVPQRARPRARRGGSGLAPPASIGGFPRLRAACRTPAEPEPAGVGGCAPPAWGGGLALAMLRGPGAPAPDAGQPPNGVSAMSPTELWPPGLSSPQLCPATTAYYTALYPQTVPPAAAPGTCLDATPHGPEGQPVHCVLTGRLPVMLSPSVLWGGVGKERGGAKILFELWGGGGDGFSVSRTIHFLQCLSGRPIHFQALGKRQWCSL